MQSGMHMRPCSHQCPTQSIHFPYQARTLIVEGACRIAQVGATRLTTQTLTSVGWDKSTDEDAKASGSTIVTSSIGHQLSPYPELCSAFIVASALAANRFHAHS